MITLLVCVPAFTFELCRHPEFTIHAGDAIIKITHPQQRILHPLPYLPFFSFFDLLTLNLGTAVVPKTTLTSAVLVFIPYCVSQTHVSPRSLGHFSLDSIRINNNKGGLMIIFSTRGRISRRYRFSPIPLYTYTHTLS